MYYCILYTWLFFLFLKEGDRFLSWKSRINLKCCTPRKPEGKETCVPQCSSQHCFNSSTWKQSRCPSAEEWIRKLWYIYTMEYYSAIKKNTFESVLMRWMKLEPIIQCEVSQKEKHQYSISSVQFSSVAQSCLTLCDPIDGSPPGCPVLGSLHTYVLLYCIGIFLSGLFHSV